MFLALLSTHHVGGVQMAAFAAENADDSALVDLAERIARNQRLEIAEYDQLMNRLEYWTPHGSLTMGELRAIAAVAAEEQ